MAKHIPIPIGTQFGQWTVVGIPCKSHNSRHIYYLCRCSCGNIRSIESSRLRKGYATKCQGCGYRSAGKTKINANRKKYPNATHQVPHDPKDRLHRRTYDGEAMYQQLKKTGCLDE